MMKKDQRKKEQDFKTAKILAMFFRFFGCAVTLYFAFQSVLVIFSSYEKNQTSGIVIFVILTVFFVYLAIVFCRQGIHASKAKKVDDLP
jgi:TRAP-type mannitol/chloroaromatic compound transport system permease small subunit